MLNEVGKKIIDVKIGNIIKENSKDKVILMGTYSSKDSKYIENLEIAIKSEEIGSDLNIKISYTGYNMQLFLADFNGDGKDEIMLRGQYGGSGGYEISAIYKYDNGNIIEILNPDIFSNKYLYTAKYIEGYKVLVESPVLKNTYIFDISKTPKEYLQMVYDKNGKPINGESPTISAINEAFPIKLVNQENYYLLIRQRVIGVNNADTIGYIESYTNLLNDDIKIINSGAYINGEDKSSNRCKKCEMLDVFPFGTKIINLTNNTLNNDKILLNTYFKCLEDYLVTYILEGIPYLGVVRKENNNYTFVNNFKGQGYKVNCLLIKKIGKKYYIFIGFEIDEKVSVLEILTYKKGKIIKAFNYGELYYSKLQIKDLDNDGYEELILWTHDKDEAYNVQIYLIKDNKVRKTDKYNKIYSKQLIEYYNKLLDEFKDSEVYLYHLALAYNMSEDYRKAITLIDKALKYKCPYPSKECLEELKRDFTKNLFR